MNAFQTRRDDDGSRLPEHEPERRRRRAWRPPSVTPAAVHRTARGEGQRRAATLVALLALPLAFPHPASADPALERAHRILRSAPLIDGHNDLPWAVREDSVAHGDPGRFEFRHRTTGHTDLERLRRGQVGGQFWSVYIPGRLPGGGYARMQLEQIDLTRRLIARYPEELALALGADEIERAFRRGRIASLLGLEGGHAIENSLALLRAYYELGARYMTLTHNVTLDWADAALDSARHGGLTSFGEEVVREMNRLGMLVDLSHTSDATTEDALRVSEAPVIFSHSSARAVADMPRNVPDSILVRLARNGSVVMVMFATGVVSPQAADSAKVWWPELDRLMAGASSDSARERIAQEFWATRRMPSATLAQVADHIEHIRRVAGVDHVGLGSDFDGTRDLPVGLEDVSKYPDLIAELVRRGWSDADLRKLAGGNLLRVMSEAEAVARRLHKTRPPSTATIEELDGR
jgi:membrane dipeptidase